MHQREPLPDRNMAGFKIRFGASDVVKDVEQDFIWKDIDRRCIECTPVTLAYPTKLEVSARPSEK